MVDQPLPDQPQPEPTIWCLNTYIDTNRKTISQIAQSLGADIGLSSQSEICKAVFLRADHLYHRDSVALIRASNPIQGTNNPAAENEFFTDYTWTRPMTEQEIDQYSCLFPNSTSVEVSKSLIVKLGDFLVSIMPSTPENLRLPTIVSQIAGTNQLYGQLLLVIYSGIWQYLLILVAIKFYKMLPFIK